MSKNKTPLEKIVSNPSSEEREDIFIMFLYRTETRFIWYDVTKLKDHFNFDLVLHLQNLEDLTEEDKHGKIYGFSEQIEKRARPGMIFKFSIEKGKPEIIYHKIKDNPYVKTWPNHENILHWRALYEAWEDKEQIEKDIAKHGDRRFQLERLLPIKEAYHKLPSPQKSIMLARIVQFIVS